MRKIVDFANLTAAVLVGAYLFLLTVLSTDGLRLIPDSIVASAGLRILFLLAGAALVALNIHILMEDWKAGGLRSNLRLSTDQGTTEFSVPSMEMLILRDLRAEADIVDPVVFLQPRGEGKPMLCKVEMKLRRQKDVLNRIDSVKKKVRDIIDGLIPGGLTVEVLVEVRDFVAEASAGGRTTGRSGREHAHGAGAAPGEFNGPVYTDGGGSDGV